MTILQIVYRIQEQGWNVWGPIVLTCVGCFGMGFGVAWYLALAGFIGR